MRRMLALAFAKCGWTVTIREKSPDLDARRNGSMWESKASTFDGSRCTIRSRMPRSPSASEKFAPAPMLNGSSPARLLLNVLNLDFSGGLQGPDWGGHPFRAFVDSTRRSPACDCRVARLSQASHQEFARAQEAVRYFHDQINFCALDPGDRNHVVDRTRQDSGSVERNRRGAGRLHPG